MTAPTISAIPAAPVFPSGPGLPDQPAVFIPKFLAMLAALGNWPDELAAFAAYLEGLSGGTSGGASWIPAVTGAEPAALLSNGAGELIQIAGP